MPSPRFVRGLHAYLDHWLEKTVVLDDATISQLNPDFPSLLHIVELGLVLPETREQTANLVLQCFFWVEQVGYGQVWQPLVALAAQQLPAGHVNLRFRLLKQLGQFQRLQYQLDTAVATLQEAEQLAHTLADEQALAEIHMNLCQVFHLKRDYKVAESYGRAALNTLADDRPKLKAITHRTLGIIAQEQGYLQQAEEQLQTSLKFSFSPGDQALTLNILAVIYQQKKQYDHALEIYNELLARLDLTAGTNLFVEVQLNKGSLLYDLNRLSEAEAIFHEAEKLVSQRPGLVFHKARLANNLGCIWRDQNQFLIAEASLRRSIEQFGLVGADIYQAIACGNLAKLYGQQERRAEAFACYDKALQLVAVYPDNALAQELASNYTHLSQELS